MTILLCQRCLYATQHAFFKPELPATNQNPDRQSLKPKSRQKHIFSTSVAQSFSLFCCCPASRCWCVSGVHVDRQLEVFKGVEGDVSIVHHGNDHRDISALERQQLDSVQVGNGTVETAGKQTAWYYTHRLFSVRLVDFSRQGYKKMSSSNHKTNIYSCYLSS